MDDTDRMFAGKTAVVTGSSRRMGRAIAMRLAESGASLVINARTSRSDAEAVAAEIRAGGGQAIAILADITRPEDVQRMADRAISEFGGVDILVNNVAIRSHTPLAETSLDEWRRVLSSILDGSFLCAQAFAPALVQRRGSLINIGGASAHFGQKNHVSVMTAKMGLVGLTRALAIDLGPDVLVNCLIPGRIDGPGDKRAASGRYPLERIPAGRSGTLEEVAEAVAMLCNPRCRFINGQAIHISGGMLFGI